MSVVQLVTIKRFTYRGVTEDWSNRYHLSGTQPADAAAWAAVAVQMKDLEKAILPSTVQIVHWYAYNSGAVTASASGDLLSSIAGTFSTTGGVVLSGDTANWVRWATGDMNSKGKPIYLRKYFHPGIGTTSDPDTTLASWRTAAATFGAALTNGTSLNGALKICRPSGTIGSTVLACTTTTTRTLKRRGKREDPS